MKINSRTWKVIAVVLIVGVSSLVGTLYLSGAFQHNSSTPSLTTGSSSTTIINASSNYTVRVGSYHYIPFKVNSHSSIYGSFTSTIGVNIFILYSQYSTSLSSKGIPNHYVFTTGRVKSGTVSANLSPGTYDLVLFNDNNLGEVTTVTFMTNLTLTA